VTTTIVICPFAQFGNPGTAHGAELIGDALREMLADNRRETRPTRSRAYGDAVKVKEITFATPADYASWPKRARAAARQALDAGDFLVWVGGNHLSVLPLYEEIAARDRPVVVQFDAHLDVYHHDDCVRELSHGNFIRHLERRPPIVNVGHRDLFLLDEEIAEYFELALPAEAVGRDAAGTTRTIASRVARGRTVLVDIDFDVLDPAFFPAVVDSLPFGLSPDQLLSVTAAVGAKRSVDALAVSEFDPGRDDRDRSLALAVWFIERQLLLRYER
jgi:agmatinase